MEPGWESGCTSGDGIAVPDRVVFAIGDTGPGGGIVFSVSEDGTSGLEAAPVDQTDDAGVAWCNSLVNVVGVNNTASFTDDINSGSENTPLIRDTCGEDSAAGVAAAYIGPDGSTADWFLPNIQELLEMNSAIGPGCDVLANPECNVGGFATGFQTYWSSSDISFQRAWGSRIESTASSIRLTTFKTQMHRVRAIRRF